MLSRRRRTVLYRSAPAWRRKVTAQFRRASLNVSVVAQDIPGCEGSPSGPRAISTPIVARLQRPRDRFGDIAADERFAEHIDYTRGLRAFAQLRTAVAAHEYD
jgi:hypothetical protein